MHLQNIKDDKLRRSRIRFVDSEVASCVLERRRRSCPVSRSKQRTPLASFALAALKDDRSAIGVGSRQYRCATIAIWSRYTEQTDTDIGLVECGYHLSISAAGRCAYHVGPTLDETKIIASCIHRRLRLFEAEGQKHYSPSFAKKEASTPNRNRICLCRSQLQMGWLRGKSEKSHNIHGRRLLRQPGTRGLGSHPDVR